MKKHLKDLSAVSCVRRILFFIVFVLMSGGIAVARDESFCGGYAAKAVEQTNEYHFRKCRNPGNSQWWSTDAAYHLNWCLLEPDGSKLPEKGEADRANVIELCQSAALQRGSPADHPSSLTCPDTIGTLQFRDGDIEAVYFGPPKPPSDGSKMACNYRYADGIITLYATWAVGANLGWDVTAPVQFGCAQNAGLPESYSTSLGLGMRSAKFFADAGIVGSTNETVAAAQTHGFGALQNFIIGAELQARSCLQRGNY